MNKEEWMAGYTDRRTWILDHLEQLHLDCEEALVCCLIDLANQNNQPVSHEILAEKTKLDENRIEQIFQDLSDKGYLSIVFVDGNPMFELSGLLDALNVEGQPIQRSLIERFEMEFKRPLSQGEMQRILDLAQRYDQRRVIVALNEAVVYEKLGLDYIEHILVSWANKGLSIEDLENGVRNETK
ncbi:MAG: DnaD domain protein [Erysipelotrichaceae bacterium]|nr:DnaD domain protein [Erysipelotrichaceae bacterium]